MLDRQVKSNRHLPDFRQPLLVLRVIVFAEGLALLLAFAPFTAESSAWYRLGFISVFVQWIALVSCLTFSWLTPLLCRIRFWQLALVTQSILLSITAVCTVLSFWYFKQLAPEINLASLLINNLVICFIVALLVIQFLVMADEQSKRITAQSQAELNALQARIRPHFLFNSLNSVAELIHHDAAAAEQALLNLAALFRAAMQSATTVWLSEELEFCRHYLSIEQWRLGKRLAVRWLISDPLPRLQLPALTLQPLIENAILHGIEPSPAGGEISISISQVKQRLVIAISNPVPERSQRNTHNGMALQNIQQRLAYAFANDAQLEAEAGRHQFTVTLYLPINKQE